MNSTFSKCLLRHKSLISTCSKKSTVRSHSSIYLWSNDGSNDLSPEKLNSKGFCLDELDNRRLSYSSAINNSLNLQNLVERIENQIVNEAES
jgi:hypothetical protein